jgi:hypothetical protein
VPFLFDLSAQARLLLSVPLLIAADVLVHRRIKATVQQFEDRAIIASEDRPQFESIIASAMRLRNSTIMEVLLLAVAIIAGSWAGERYVTMHVATWSAVPVGEQMQLTGAGYYYTLVSLTIFRFLVARWGFRLFVWYRFLWQVSRRIPLQLNALHPDRSGGVGFLSGSIPPFVPVLLAFTVALSGTIGGRIWHEGATLPQFKLEIATWLVFLMLLVLAPLCFFMIQLATARRNGLREYGLVASQFVTDFRKKWIKGHVTEGETLADSADIQSLADLSNSFEVVRGMRLVPFTRTAMLRLAAVIVLPLLPLVLTMIPIEQLIDRAVGMFL